MYRTWVDLRLRGRNQQDKEDVVRDWLHPGDLHLVSAHTKKFQHGCSSADKQRSHVQQPVFHRESCVLYLNLARFKGHIHNNNRYKVAYAQSSAINNNLIEKRLKSKKIKNHMITQAEVSATDSSNHIKLHVLSDTRGESGKDQSAVSCQRDV